MVHITDPKEDMKNTNKDFENDIRKYDNIQVENIKDFVVKESKPKRISMRLNDNLLNNLKTYAKVNNMTMTEVIEGALKDKFKNKIVRDQYNIKPVMVLIPNTIELIKQYREKKINLIVNIGEDIEPLQRINAFDKQSKLYESNKDKFDIYTIDVTNNYLDTYISETNNYFDASYYNENNKDISKDWRHHTRHLGLIVIEHPELEQFEEIENGYVKIKDPVPIFLLIREYIGEIENVTIISKNEAMKRASLVSNMPIMNYMYDYEDIEKIREIKEPYDIISTLITETSVLKEEINKLKAENTRLLENTSSNDSNNLEIPEEKTKKYSTEELYNLVMYLEEFERNNQILKQEMEMQSKKAKELEEILRNIK